MDDLISRKELNETLVKLSLDGDVANLSKTFTVKELSYIIANQPKVISAKVGNFTLTKQMIEDRNNCGEDSRCDECSCCLGEEDCIFAHLD